MPRIMKKLVALFIVPFLILLPFTSFASEEKLSPPKTEITHKPVEKVSAGERVSLAMEVEDPAGVDEVRVYFKAMAEGDYSFVQMQMQQEGASSYGGVLPAPANGTGQFEYLILVKNSENVVVKSQSYTVLIEDKDEIAAYQEKLQVYTELPEAPEVISGFSDNLAIDVIESSAKFGAVAGLYSSVSASGVSASQGGSIVASPGGLSTTAIVTGVVLGAAVVGLAAGGGGGSGGGSGSSSGSSGGSGILGAWNYNQIATTPISSVRCEWNGTATFRSDNTVFYDAPVSCTGPSPTTMNQTGSAPYSLNGNNITIGDGSQGTAIARGTVSGNTIRTTATMDGGFVWNATYTR